MKRWTMIGALALVPTSALAGGSEPFEYEPAGALLPDSGQGAMDDTVYAPGMRFPMEEGPAYANSQVYMNGGYLGPGGGQCDEVNYSYPWRDNYCEIRSWNMPLCPSGQGHQGQDIRPATCDDGVHWNVATTDGTVTNVGSYSIYVTAADGTRFDFLHGTGNVVGSGQALTRGERINRVSNEFGGTSTTIHTHFNIKQDVAGLGFIFVSPYMSLVTGYQELFGLVGNGNGALESTSCQALEGWAWDESTPDTPVPVQLSFGGPLDGTNPVLQIDADQHREDLCKELGSCEHGFSVEVPLSLRDGQSHAIHAYAVEGGGETQVELADSPLSFQCDPPAVPDGVKRLVAGPEVVSAWGIEPFFDIATIDDATVDGIPEGSGFPEEPVVVVSDADPGTHWLMDPGYRREIPSEAVAAAWGLDLAAAQTWPASVVDDVPTGTPVRAERFVLRDSMGRVFVVDDAQCPLLEDGTVDPDCDAAGDDGLDGDSDGGGDGNGDGGGDGGDDGTAGGDGGSDGTGDGAAADDEGGKDGCGCRTGSGGSGWALMLLSLAAVRRRRG